MKVWKHIKKNKIRCACIIFILLTCILVTTSGILLYVFKLDVVADSFSLQVTPKILVSFPEPQVITLEAIVNRTETVYIPNGEVTKETVLPSFITYVNDLLKVSPTKGSNGEYTVKFLVDSTPVTYSIIVKNTNVDFDALKLELIKYLAKEGLTDRYGIYLKDIGRNEVLDINGDTVFPPASMAKLTMAVLVLRDIDAGKYTLDTTYPLQSDVIFNPDDDLAKLGVGTEVPIRTYLERMIEDSNNTAWYHMDKFLGGSYESVNPRTVNELGLNPLFLNPHQGTAHMLAKLLDDVYHAKTVSAQSRDYLIGLMENALEWNREGIGLGLPEGIQFANKIGNLWTDNDVNFCDSAVVYGKNTDYILVIMNKDIDWETGKVHLKDLSKIVYNYLDK